MHEIKQLEEDWSKYHLKKRRPFYLFLVLLFLVSLGYILYSKFSFTSLVISKDKIFHNRTTLLNEEKDTSVNPLLNGPIKILEVNTNNKVVVNNETHENIDLSEALVDVPILDIEKQDNIVPSDNTDKVDLHIIQTSNESAYIDVENRFQESHDIDDALFLARSYYQKRNYKKALQWALEVNKLNDSIEESIFIFVKSKVILGHKSEGLSILRTYINNTKSLAAQKLLDKLKNN